MPITFVMQGKCLFQDISKSVQKFYCISFCLGMSVKKNIKLDALKCEHTMYFLII